MKATFGDVIEIDVGSGLAYAIYTHRHDRRPRYGALLRVFEGVFPERPQDLQSIVSLPIRFSVFFPLQAAVDREILKVIGNVEIPDELKPFPLFRDGLPNPTTNRVDKWWLWDGEKEWPVTSLTLEQRGMPLREIINDTLLVERINAGWRPEDEF